MRRFKNCREIGDLSGAEYEEICRANTGYVYTGSNTIICRILSMFKLYVDSKDAGIAPHMIMDGFWESWLTQLLAREVRDGDVCMDIGANFGFFSVLMSELCGPSGKTIAVEPNLRICELLRATRLVNGNKFDILQGAAGAETGEATLVVEQTELGGGTIKPHDAPAGKQQYTVKVFTVDQVVVEKQLTKVNIVKIDVEGMEPAVFQGMEKTIENNPRIRIITEYSPSIYAEPEAFTKFLFDRFSVSRIKDVETRIKLNKSDIPALLDLQDHTDLYLQVK